MGAVKLKEKQFWVQSRNRVTTCLENLEMSGNYTDVREMSGIALKVMEMSGNCQEKILSWKIASTGFLVALT